jgi:hypothetical protein
MKIGDKVQVLEFNNVFGTIDYISPNGRVIGIVDKDGNDIFNVAKDRSNFYADQLEVIEPVIEERAGLKRVTVLEAIELIEKLDEYATVELEFENNSYCAKTSKFRIERVLRKNENNSLGESIVFIDFEGINEIKEEEIIYTYTIMYKNKTIKYKTGDSLVEAKNRKYYTIFSNGLRCSDLPFSDVKSLIRGNKLELIKNTPITYKVK